MGGGYVKECNELSCLVDGGQPNILVKMIKQIRKIYIKIKSFSIHFHLITSKYAYNQKALIKKQFVRSLDWTRITFNNWCRRCSTRAYYFWCCRHTFIWLELDTLKFSTKGKWQILKKHQKKLGLGWKNWY